jgi:hypothetical protein
MNRFMLLLSTYWRVGFQTIDIALQLFEATALGI